MRVQEKLSNIERLGMFGPSGINLAIEINLENFGQVLRLGSQKVQVVVRQHNVIFGHSSKLFKGLRWL
jgi:hypothetical protein